MHTLFSRHIVNKQNVSEDKFTFKHILLFGSMSSSVVLSQSIYGQFCYLAAP